METSFNQNRMKQIKEQNWDRNEFQGKSRKQVEDSCKFITWGMAAVIVALLASMIFKY
jgi:hypothetical protein